MRGISLITVILAFAMIANAYAYYNITYVNTTLILNKNQSAHVIENFYVYVSNSSMNQYTLDRAAGGLNISYWQGVLYTHALREHIVSKDRSIYNFLFLVGPLAKTDGGGDAVFEMSYYVNNVTSLENIAPRELEYRLNNSIFNFQQTASGQALPADTRLNFMIPSGARALSIYPLPDSPRPDFMGNYTNTTLFSWYSGESLNKLTFAYVIKQTLQEEVLEYFKGVYRVYGSIIYGFGVIVIVLFIIYAYLKSGRTETRKGR